MQLYHPRRMGQRIIYRTFIFFLLAMAGQGCGQESSPPPVQTDVKIEKPTVASLVPAATELLLGMGAADQVIAVSNFDADREGTAGLPRVGDYRTVDWEKLSELRPDIMIIQVRPDKLDPGLAQRAEQMNIRLVNVSIYRLEDIFTTIQVIGEAVDRPEEAAAAAKKLRDQLDAVRRRVKGRELARTLISIGESPLSTAGGGTFVDDLLEIAGGKNVIQGGFNSYPTIDREMLLQHDPDTVLQLLPDASQQVMEQAAQFWKSMPQLSAVKRDRVYFLMEWYLLLPGLRVGDVAERFAERLHPAAPPAARVEDAMDAKDQP